LAFAELRESKQMTRQEMTQTLGVSRHNVSRIEPQDDVYLSTLSHYVEALCGQLEVRAVFPEGSVALLERDTDRE
jgi:DNA-binding XRE family transcriptional regulator